MRLFEHNDVLNHEIDYGIKRSYPDSQYFYGNEAKQIDHKINQEQPYLVNKETGEIFFIENDKISPAEDYYSIRSQYFKVPDIRDRNWGNIAYQPYYSYDYPMQTVGSDYYTQPAYEESPWRNYRETREIYYDHQIYEPNSWGNYAENEEFNGYEQIYDNVTLVPKEKCEENDELAVDCDEIVHYGKVEYKKFIENNKFGKDQIKELSELRRRGRNRIAARECRERKNGQISELNSEIENLETRKAELLEEKSRTEKELKGLMGICKVDEFDF